MTRLRRRKSGIIVGCNRCSIFFLAGYRRKVVPLVRTSAGLATCDGITSYTEVQHLGVKKRRAAFGVSSRCRDVEIGGATYFLASCPTMVGVVGSYLSGNPLRQTRGVALRKCFRTISWGRRSMRCYISTLVQGHIPTRVCMCNSQHLFLS
jgi:hypothetical protein